MNNIAILISFCYTFAEVFTMKLKKILFKALKIILSFTVIAAVLVTYFKLNTTVSSDFTFASAKENEFYKIKGGN